MEQWIYCNKCSRSLKFSRRDFCLTSCQHIFCSECSTMATQRCPECSSVGMSTLTIQKPLQPTLVPYFKSLTEQIEHICQVVEFQCSQARIVLRRFCEMEVKYEILKKTYSRGMAKINELDTCSKGLQEEFRRHKLKQATLSQSSKRSRSCANSQRYLISSSCREQLDAQRAAKLEILPEGINRLAPRLTYPIVEKQMSNRQPCARRNVTFARHEYQPRAIVSPESSVTPVQQQSRLRGFNSLNSSSNISSSDGTPEAPNYRCNYTARFLNAAK